LNISCPKLKSNSLSKRTQFGVNAWKNCRANGSTPAFFEVTVLERGRLSYGEANGLLPHPDRATRESANRAIYGLLGKTARSSRRHFAYLQRLGYGL
jgi:hypothetical protein